MHDMTAARVNLGCGMTPTPGWTNLDNSISVKVARSPLAPLAMALANQGQREFIRFARASGIRPASALKLPFRAGSVTVIYSSHMLEHLDQREADIFLRDALRVLRPGGVLRIGVPDIALLTAEYMRTGDADHFIEGTHMVQPKPRGLLRRLGFALFTGFRRHNWMYDGASLCNLLRSHGFGDAVVQPAGQTMIQDPGALDLAERASETVFVEAVKR